DVFGWWGGHVQLGAGDALDEGVRRPGTLLELQLPPFDLERVAPIVEPLELDEQLARAMLRVDGARGGGEHRNPERGNDDRQEFRREESHRHPLTRSATRSSALRERGLFARSASLGRILRPTILKRGSAEGGITGSRASSGATRDSRCMKSFTTRSSSEWNVI